MLGGAARPNVRIGKALALIIALFPFPRASHQRASPLREYVHVQAARESKFLGPQ